MESSQLHTAIANELQNARQEPFALRQHLLRIAMRIGFTCIESGLQRAEDALREADIALSVASGSRISLPLHTRRAWVALP